MPNSFIKYGGKLINYTFSYNEEPETTSLIGRMVIEPSVGLRSLINKTIRDLKWWGIWERLDILTFYGVHTEQAALLDWKNYQNQSNNGMSFTPKMGFLNVDGSTYINSNYAPETEAIQYQLNDAGYGVYIKDYDDNNTRILIGTRSSGGVRSFIVGNPDVGGTFTATMNNVDIGGTTVGAGGYGMYYMERNSKSYMRLIYNGLSNGNTYYLSQTVPISRTYYIAVSQSFTTYGYSKSGFQNSFIGASLTDAQHNKFYEIVKYFNDNVGGTF